MGCCEALSTDKVRLGLIQYGLPKTDLFDSIMGCPRLTCLKLQKPYGGTQDVCSAVGLRTPWLTRAM